MPKVVHYSTWIRKKKLAFFAVISLSLLLFALLMRNNILISFIIIALSCPFVYITVVLAYTYYQFSSWGGNYQSRIHDLLVKKITNHQGKLLDIGTGNGSLIIKAAKALPKVTAIGLDYWGKDWEYSQAVCESNASIEGVAKRVSFVKGSASKLPYNDNEFDIVISCLTFHEVNDTKDKALVLKEALRVLKKGGEFIFMDLFLDASVFGNLELLTTQLGVSQIDVVKVDELLPLPRLLLNKKILGNAILMKGIK